MGESKLRNQSVEFSVKIIKLCENIKEHYSITNQLERSATSIGANIHEYKYSQSPAEFVSKIQIQKYMLKLIIRYDIISSGYCAIL